MGAARAAPIQSPDERARDLLFQVLSPSERAMFIRLRRFEVTGSKGGRYRISTYGDTGNIENLTPVRLTQYGGMFGKKVEPGRTLCAHPRRYIEDQDGRYLGALPLLDRIATQVIVIKADEEHFLRTAYLYA